MDDEAAPQAAGGIVTEDADLPGAPRRCWCRPCGLPVLVNEEAELGRDRVVHEDTRQERGPDGHFAAPTGTETEAMRGAREIREEYGIYLDVVLLFGTLISARWRNPRAVNRFEDGTADGVRAQIDAVAPLKMREHAARVRAERSRR
jgi:hypothetical protein